MSEYSYYSDKAYPKSYKWTVVMIIDIVDDDDDKVNGMKML